MFEYAIEVLEIEKDQFYTESAIKILKEHDDDNRK
jgi:hypothetical protein